MIEKTKNTIKKIAYAKLFLSSFFLTTLITASISIILFGLGKSEIIQEVFTFKDIVVFGGTLFSAILLYFQLVQNRTINEATLIMKLNSEFINNKELSEVERKLEKYYYEYKNRKKRNKIKLDLSLEIDARERQMLVNYLVHLEGIATLVLKDVLKLETIMDLIAYRYFIAVNNPIVQRYELYPYKDYYMGCFELYERWSNELKKKGGKVPMEDNHLV